MLVNLDSNFLQQQIYSNLAEAQVQLSPKMGAYFGYPYTKREIADNFFNTQNAIYFPNNAARGNCARIDPAQPLTQPNLPDGCTLNGDGSISFVTPGATFGPPGVTNVNSNSSVLGLWLRPTKNLSFNLDAELTSADKTFTRVSPLQSQQVRFRMRYRPTNWLNLTGNASTMNGQNDVLTVNGLQRNWNLGFTLSLTPSPKFFRATRLQLQLYFLTNIHLLYQQRRSSGLAAVSQPPRPPATTRGLQQQSEYGVL